MNGRTHMATGCLLYGILHFSVNTPFTLEGFVVVAASSILADIDEPGSMANRMNPLTGALYFLEKVAQKLVKISVVIGLLVLTWTERELFMQLSIPTVSGLCVLSFLLISFLFRIFDHLGRVFVRFGVRMLLFLFGSSLLFFSNGNPAFILPGVFLLIAGYFRHRSVLHSPEAVILSSIGAYQLFLIVGRPDLLYPFTLGYSAHLYLGDIFTDHGVPISGIPYLLDALVTWFPQARKFRESKIMRALNKKVTLPVFKTGTALGELGEGIYVILLSGILIGLVAL